METSQVNNMEVSIDEECSRILRPRTRGRRPARHRRIIKTITTSSASVTR